MGDILITGDTYLGTPEIEELAEKGKVNELFGDFVKIIENSDLAITNLESPITNLDSEKIKKTGPYLKSSKKSLSVLKQAGFDLLTLGNNHILDYGKQGIISTLDSCKENMLNYVGAGISKEEVKKPFRTKIKGKSISILNFAENEFSTKIENNYGANSFEIINNSYDIISEKKNSDILIVIVHGGREHYPLPSPKFKQALRFFVDIGANAVIAHHTHCVSGYEIYKNSPIFYGLGNFLFVGAPNKNRPLWNIGLAVNLIISENNSISFKLHPYCQSLDGGNIIRLLEGADKSIFLKKMFDRNKVISDDVSLNLQWKKYIFKQKKSYKSLLFVKNKWVRKLVTRKLLPLNLFINESSVLHSINLIRCEAHREILLDSLLDDYND